MISVDPAAGRLSLAVPMEMKRIGTARLMLKAAAAIGKVLGFVPRMSNLFDQIKECVLGPQDRTGPPLVYYGLEARRDCATLCIGLTWRSIS